MDRPLTIGAREEGLARAQADYILGMLQQNARDFPVHLELIRPERKSKVAVHDDHIAENRKSISTLHRLLREGEIDLVIHRGFDLRDHLPEDLQIAAIPPRCSPFDALLSIDGLALDELEAGTQVGVVQRRARVQIRRYRDDLDLILVPGDIATWLTSLLEGKIQALILPNAAVEHLGLQERICEIFPSELVVPAPCSGMLVCVCRRDDELTRARLRSIHDAGTGSEYAAERALIEALGGEWTAPVASLAQCMGKRMLLLGMLADADGQRVVREGVEGLSAEPDALGEAVAGLLMRGLAFESDQEIPPDTTPALGAGGEAGLFAAIAALDEEDAIEDDEALDLDDDDAWEDDDESPEDDE